VSGNMDWTTNFDLVKEEKKNLENKIAFVCEDRE